MFYNVPKIARARKSADTTGVVAGKVDFDKAAI